MALIYLAEITGYDPDATAEVVLRYGTEGYNAPSAPGYYDGRIEQPASIQRTAFADGTTGGAIQIGVGELILANADGGLDAILDYGFDGRDLTILVGDSAAAYSSFVTVLTGTMEQPEWDFQRLRFRIRDRLSELDKPLQSNEYAGSGGLEGDTATVKDQVKPMVWGKVENIQPVLVDPTAAIYQFHDGTDADVTACYLRGKALTQGSDYTSSSDMTSNAPSAGQFRVWPGGGYLRLDAVPGGFVTVDAQQGANDAARTAAQLLKAMALEVGFPSGDINASDVTALDTANSGVCGYYLRDRSSALTVMGQIAASVGAWFGIDAAGDLRTKRLEAPSGTPVATITTIRAGSVVTGATADIITIDRIATNDAGRGVPAWKVAVGSRRSWAIQTSDLDDTADAARISFLATEFRQSSSEDSSVKTKHILAREMSVNTLLATEAAGATEATRLLALHKVSRDRYLALVKVDADLLAILDLGAVVTLRMDRFGLSSGKLMAILGITLDARRSVAELDLWG